MLTSDNAKINFGIDSFIRIFVATGRIELPLPNHRSGVAFGGFPTGLDTGSRPVCYPTRVATHGDATGRLFYVQKYQRTLKKKEVWKRETDPFNKKIIFHQQNIL